MEIKIPKPFDVPVSELRRNAKNVKHHPKDQIHDLQELIKMVGFKDPLVIDHDNIVWAGHGRLSAAEGLGMESVPCIYLDGLSEEQKKVFMLMDNKVQEADWVKENVQLVFDEVDPIEFESFDMQFDNNQVDFDSKEWVKTELAEDAESVPEAITSSDYSIGDVIELGNHRLVCGDATNPEHLEKLFKGEQPDVIITDPPYSSGGKQEAGKSGGSIGTRLLNENTGKKDFTPTIMMDNLSTRAYISLIKNTLNQVSATTIYMFTDWRMWDWTREASESAGYPIKGMLVWDKLNPGMGIEWRHQHELIYFGKKGPLKGFGRHGDVLNIKRSGNKFHPTQKPIELLKMLIGNSVGDKIYDPFSGSGSTMITCEQMGKNCYAMELDPNYVHVIVQRWENLTGKKAVKVTPEINVGV